MNTRDGLAWVQLEVGLGRPLGLPQPHPHHHQHLPRNGNSRYRRRNRRAATRNVNENVEPEAALRAAENEERNEAIEDPEHVATPAGKAEAQANVAATAEEALAVVPDNVAEEASTENVVHREIETAEEATDYICDQCDSNFNSVRALRAHKGRKHKASAVSPIPQLDGGSENFGNSFTYTFVSEFALEDIEYTLREIFPHVETNLISRVKDSWAMECRPSLHCGDHSELAEFFLARYVCGLLRRRSWRWHAMLPQTQLPYYGHTGEVQQQDPPAVQRGAEPGHDDTRG